MKSITVEEYRYDERMNNLAKEFSSNLENDCDELSFKIPAQHGEGVVRAINFDHGVGVTLIDATLNEDLELIYDLGRRHPVLFFYTKQGSIELSTEENNITHDINDNEAIIFSALGRDKYSIKIKGNIRIQCAFVSVVRYLFLRKVECDLGTIPETLNEMFKDTVGAKSFYFKTTSEPVIINTLAHTFQTKSLGLERKLLIEAQSLKLITSLIKRFRAESSVFESAYRYSATDVKQINAAKNFLIDNIRKTPTVKVLAQEIGMNTSKLQKGFHMLFGKSIRQFTISLKMHIALNLIDERDKSISEIAYEIGYTNKGHFSQLFKKEFGLLPSEYASRQPLRGMI